MKKTLIIALLTALSLTATRAADVFQSGFLKKEFYANQTRVAVEEGTAGVPTSVSALTAFEIGSQGDNYAQRISGFFTPATTGQYVFFLAADDDADLFLSTDENPANKKMIAQEASWSNSRMWNTPGGGSSTPENKRSDAFVDPVTGANPFPNGITLTAGRKYYIEAVHHEGGGGDLIGVYVKKATDVDPADGDAPSTAGGSWGFNAAPATITIATQPAAVTATEGRQATLSVTVTTDSAYGIAGYQWKKGGTAIAGATSASYTTPTLALADTGGSYTVEVTAAGAPAVTSTPAVVTVVADTFPPTLVAAGSLKNFNANATEVSVVFDEPLDEASATTLANYSLSSGTISAARYVSNSSGTDRLERGVILTVAGLTAGTEYTLSVKGVKDIKGNAMSATPATLKFKASSFNWVSIGRVENFQPAAVAVGDNDFNLVSGGLAYWSSNDDITMVYEEITGDFDKSARVEFSDPSSNWARSGISARESINKGQPTTDAGGDNPASRYQMVIADPTTKFDGTAANNSHETNRRLDAGGATSSSNAGGTPAYPNAWVRLKRVGQNFSMFYGSDGLHWRPLGTTDFGDINAVPGGPLADKMFVGPTFGPENGNIGDEALRRLWATRIRQYGNSAGNNKAFGNQAYGIGLSFGANEAAAQLAATDVAGVDSAAQANWNNIFGQNSTDTGPITGIVADKKGTKATTPVTVEFISNNTWASYGPRGENNSSMAGADAVLMTGYLDSGGATTSSVTIDKIPADLTGPGYEVIVYFLGGVPGRGGAFRVVDGNGTALVDWVRAQGNANPTGFVGIPADPTATTYATGNYVVFKNLKAAKISVEATTDNGLGFGGTPRAPINAVQLVPAGTVRAGAPTVAISVTAGRASIAYTGTLESAPAVNGPWTAVTGATSPYAVTTSGAQLFYRTRQ